MYLQNNNSTPESNQLPETVMQDRTALYQTAETFADKILGSRATMLEIAEATGLQDPDEIRTEVVEAIVTGWPGNPQSNVGNSQYQR
tara:strand:- start:1088 stop:1348 length:261 start_codon:yes stop_codon:yes gene_type:complete